MDRNWNGIGILLCHSAYRLVHYSASPFCFNTAGRSRLQDTNDKNGDNRWLKGCWMVPLGQGCFAHVVGAGLPAELRSNTQQLTRNAAGVPWW